MQSFPPPEEFSAPQTAAPPQESFAPENSNAAETGDKIFRFEFRGTAREYFKIWLANTTLTILTLGIYSAWAKVRTKRYFYGNIYLDEANFEYHAKPLSILISRLVLVVLIIGIGYWVSGDTVMEEIHYLFLAFMLPWALVRSFSFNARNSSYRNVNFSFRREYRRIYWIFGRFIAACILSLYILDLLFADYWTPSLLDVEATLYSYPITILYILFIPPFLRSFHQIKATYHAWGALHFKFRMPSFKKYWKFFYLAALWVLFGLTLFVWALFIVDTGKMVMEGKTPYDDVHPLILLFLGAGLPFFAIIGSVLVYLASGILLFRLFWNGVIFQEGKVRCNIPFWRFLFYIRLVNFFAVILSLGFLYPWAAVRKTKFLAKYMEIVALPKTADNIAARRGEDESAFGQEFEAAQGFDFDVGLI